MILRLCAILFLLPFLGANSEAYLFITYPNEVIVINKRFDKPLEDYMFYGNSSLTKIKEVIGRRESRNNYHISNQIGCLGKYQFAKSTLKGLGYSKEEIKSFISDTLMQEFAMRKLVQTNYDWLKTNRLLKYDTKIIGGVKISVEGMLAALHLLGGESLKDYLHNNGSMEQYYKTYPSGKRIYIRKYDGNKTSIKDYLNLFK